MKSILILMLFLLCVNLWTAGPEMSYYYEVNVVYTNNDTLHCYLNLTPSSLKPKDSNQESYVVTGTDIKSLLIPLKEISYITEYSHHPQYGYLAINENFHYLSTIDSTIAKILYIKNIKGINRRSLSIVSKNMMQNIENKGLVSTYSYPEDGGGETVFYNFDRDVSNHEFKYIVHCYILEGLPFKSPDYNYDFRNNYLSHILHYENYLEYEEKDMHDFHVDIPLKSLSYLIDQRKKILLQMKDIKPKHTELINSIVNANNRMIQDMEFLHEWFECEYNKTSDINIQKSVEMKLINEFEKMYDRYAVSWKTIIKNHEDDLKNFNFNCIYTASE